MDFKIIIIAMILLIPGRFLGGRSRSWGPHVLRDLIHERHKESVDRESALIRKNEQIQRGRAELTDAQQVAQQKEKEMNALRERVYRLTQERSEMKMDLQRTKQQLERASGECQRLHEQRGVLVNQFNQRLQKYQSALKEAQESNDKLTKQHVEVQKELQVSHKETVDRESALIRKDEQIQQESSRFAAEKLQNARGRAELSDAQQVVQQMEEEINALRDRVGMNPVRTEQELERATPETPRLHLRQDAITQQLKDCDDKLVEKSAQFEDGLDDGPRDSNQEMRRNLQRTKQQLERSSRECQRLQDQRGVLENQFNHQLQRYQSALKEAQESNDKQRIQDLLMGVQAVQRKEVEIQRKEVEIQRLVKDLRRTKNKLQRLERVIHDLGLTLEQDEDSHPE